MFPAPQETRTYFTTTTTGDHRRLFQVENYAELLMSVINTHRNNHRFHVHAFVIMPDHLHLLLTPAPDVSLEKSMQLIKGTFSHALKDKGKVWTPGFSSTQVKDGSAFAEFKTYIEQNPVRKHLAETAETFRYSSASGVFPIDPPPPWIDGR